MRHTFALWFLLAYSSPVRLAKLMGHGSKRMVFETYGPYAEGIEDDVEAIRAYMGFDYSFPKRLGFFDG